MSLLIGTALAAAAAVFTIIVGLFYDFSGFVPEEPEETPMASPAGTGRTSGNPARNVKRFSK